MNQTRTKPILISVCIVVRNAASTIKAALNSVVAQKTAEIELIVVDGLSNDGTIEIVKSYGDAVTAFICEPDRGIYDAMNKAWSIAKGQFIYFLGADDRLVHLPVDELRRLGGAGPAGLCGCVKLGDAKVHRPSFGFTLRFQNTLHHQGLFLKRAEFQEGPFNKDFKRFADFDVNQRLQILERQIVLIDRVICEFAAGGCSSSGPSALPEMKAIIEKNRGRTYYLFAVVTMRVLGVRARIRSLYRIFYRALATALNSRTAET